MIGPRELAQHERVKPIGRGRATERRGGRLDVGHVPDDVVLEQDAVVTEQVATNVRTSCRRVASSSSPTLCGAVSQYNATGPVSGPDLVDAIKNRLTLLGYLVMDHYDLFDEYVAQAVGWLRDGSLRSEETVVHGIENAVEAFLGLLRGANTGKMLGPPRSRMRRQTPAAPRWCASSTGTSIRPGRATASARRSRRHQPRRRSCGARRRDHPNHVMPIHPATLDAGAMRVHSRINQRRFT